MTHRPGPALTDSTPPPPAGTPARGRARRVDVEAYLGLWEPADVETAWLRRRVLA